MRTLAARGRSTTRRSRLVVLSVVATTTLLLLAAPAPAPAASAGLKPSEAPLASVGQHYFGNTNNTGVEDSVEFWRLPPLLTGDAITVAWHTSINEGSAGPLGPFFCLTQNVDDYNWSESGNICNASEKYGVARSGSARSAVEVRADTSDAFLEFQGCEASCLNGEYNGAYDFVIESIQHAIGVSLIPAKRIRPTSTLTGSANLSNGSPVPDGLVFTLTARWATPSDKAVHHRRYRVSSQAGRLTFQLRLPHSAWHKRVSLVVTRSADAEYLAAKSVRYSTRAGRQGGFRTTAPSG